VKKLFKNNWWKILLIFLGWQALIFGAASWFAGVELLPFSPSYSSPEKLEQLAGSQLGRRLGGFDGVHYLTIIQEGYRTQTGPQAFFPLYPLVVRGLTKLGLPPLAAALGVSSVGAFGFLLLSFCLVSQRFSTKIGWWFIWLTILNPISFYLLTVYNESLFLLLLISALFAYRSKKYWWTAIFCALLSAARIVGVILPVALIIDSLFHAWQNHQLKQPVTYRRLGILFLGCLGLIAYMIYLWFTFGDPVYFMTVQSSFGSGRQTDSLVLLPQVFWRYAKMFYYGLPWPDLKTTAIVQELVFSLFYLVSLLAVPLINLRRRREVYPWSWWLFSCGAYLVPTLTGNLSSMPRYLLVCLSVPLLLATYFGRRERSYRAHDRFLWAGDNWGMGVGMVFLSGTTLLLLFNLLLFVQGYWVS